MGAGWIKLSTEILSDPRSARLPDDLWRRLIELHLLANRIDGGGRLPGLHDMAWYLRLDAGILRLSLSDLLKRGLINISDGDYHIVYWLQSKHEQVRREFTPSLREEILERDDFTCEYCGGDANTVDHIIPVAQGGTNDPDNLTAACFTCNREKWDRTPEQWDRDRELPY